MLEWCLRIARQLARPLQCGIDIPLITASVFQQIYCSSFLCGWRRIRIAIVALPSEAAWTKYVLVSWIGVLTMRIHITSFCDQCIYSSVWLPITDSLSFQTSAPRHMSLFRKCSNSFVSSQIFLSRTLMVHAADLHPFLPIVSLLLEFILLPRTLQTHRCIGRWHGPVLGRLASPPHASGLVLMPILPYVTALRTGCWARYFSMRFFALPSPNVNFHEYRVQGLDFLKKIWDTCAQPTTKLHEVAKFACKSRLIYTANSFHVLKVQVIFMAVNGAFALFDSLCVKIKHFGR